MTMDLLKPAVLTAETNENHQRTHEQKKCRTQKQRAKNTMPKCLIWHSIYYWPRTEANSRLSGEIIREKPDVGTSCDFRFKGFLN